MLHHWSQTAPKNDFLKMSPHLQWVNAIQNRPQWVMSFEINTLTVSAKDIILKHLVKKRSEEFIVEIHLPKSITFH